MSGSLAILSYVLIAKELPVPDVILRRIETRLAEAGLSIHSGHAQLDPTGKILLEDVQLRSKQFSDPLLLARLVYARRSVWSILAGRPIPDEIRIGGATLQLPAIISPSGVAEPMIRDISAVFRYDGGNTCHIDQFTGQLGKLRIPASGDVAIPTRSSPQKVLPQEVISHFLKLGRNVVLKTDLLAVFDSPSINVRFETTPGEATTAWCTFNAEASSKPWGVPIDVGQIAATASVNLSHSEEQIVHSHISAKYINRNGVFAANSVHASLNLKLRTKEFTVQPYDGWVVAGLLKTDGEEIFSPMVRADLREWPLVKGTVVTMVDGEVINLDAKADLDTKNATVGIEGRGTPEAINRILKKHTPRAAPYFVFSDPVRTIASATFGPGWRFKELSSRVWAGRINSRGVEITSARGKIDIQGMSFLAYDAQVELGKDFGRGSYWMDFASSDYRMLLEGDLRPQKISGWFGGSWWTDFWNDHFDFSSGIPHGDVDVQGRWRDSSHTEYFGKAVTSTAGVWGGTFDRVEALVFLRPFFTHVVNFKGTRSGGTQTLSGSLKRIAAVEGRESNVEFSLTGNVDSETYHEMLNGKADEVLSTLQLAAPPQVHAEGVISSTENDSLSSKYRFTAHSVGDLKYYGFPIHALAVSGQVEGNDVTLNDIRFSALGGEGAGKATLNGLAEKRRLGFDLYLNNADLPLAIRTVQDFQAAHNGSKSFPATDNNFIKRALGGRMDVALSAQGNVGEINTFVGTGNAAVNGANLGEVQLFGLLSQVLSGLSFRFSTLKLDSAHTSFRWEHDHLHFPDLKITGPSAAIDAQGDFFIKNSNLDFTAKFKPFEESKSLFTAALGIVINPITSILELKLSGPLSKPNWSIDFGSSMPRHESSATKETVPETGAATVAK